MGKKRNTKGASLARASQLPLHRDEQIKYHVNETFADSEDEFFAGRDEILLDGGHTNKRRRLQEDDEFLQPSDEEVLGHDEAISSADDDSHDDDVQIDTDGSESQEADREKGENLRDWGTSKADYYNADAIETEADALEEEQEARRLQQKQLANLTEADFGFDEYQWAQEDTAANGLSRDTFTERLPELEVKDDAPPEERAQVFRNRYPEFEPLARDFGELQKVHGDLSLASQAAEGAVENQTPAGQKKNDAITENLLSRNASVATIKLRALSAYLGAIGMYFAVLTSTSSSNAKPAMAKSPASLRKHPVMHCLFRTRQLWERAKDLAIPNVNIAGVEAGVESHVDIESTAHTNGTNIATVSDVRPKGKRQSRAERAAFKAQQAADAERQRRIQRAEGKLASLDSLISTKIPGARATATKATARREGGGGEEEEDSDLGDEEALTGQEAAEKAQRKKSLRFYTSQIAQKSNKRGAAARDAGGDADLPYKERINDRQERLMREAERRGRADPRQDERLGNDYDDGDGDGEGEEEYYNLIAKKTKQRKQATAAARETTTKTTTTTTGTETETKAGTDPKRGISYAISKNKGLQPRRKKEVRNPRVKKKLAYEAKVKKLGSIRPVYKAGREGRGGYGGEVTGIKTNLRKGIQL